MAREDIYSPPEADLGDVDLSSQTIDDPNLASRWARLGAVLIDGLVLGLPGAILMYDTEYWHRAINQEITLQENLVSYVAGVIIYFAVNGYLLSRRGQSIGKYVLGIRIVSSKDNQLLPLWKIACLRYIPQTLVALIPIVGQLLSVINVLFIFRRDKRCVHDIIAGTKVIKEYAH